MKRYFLAAAVLLLAVGDYQAQAEEKTPLAKVLAYSGKSFPNVKSSEYVGYDMAMRAYLVERVQRRFGVNLDPRKYSAFDLLEIESLFQCKKPGESFDVFLIGFPKNP